jgi:hypothetical protein
MLRGRPGSVIPDKASWLSSEQGRRFFVDARAVVDKPGSLLKNDLGGSGRNLKSLAAELIGGINRAGTLLQPGP